LFLGYERYFAAWLAAAGGAWEQGRRWWQARANSRLSGARLLAIQGYFRLTGPRRRRYVARARQWFCPGWVEQAQADLAAMPSDLGELQRGELLADGLPLQLRLDDRTSAGLGMELRVPFLDYRLVEFAWRLPWRNKIHEGWTKHLLRRYLARHGLESIAWRRDKLGFNAPTADWTREVYRARREALHEAPARRLLRDGRLPGEAPFAVYNLLELSHQLEWDEAALN
jgi:asparagine synthase (glutamine-hydrolysing)